MAKKYLVKKKVVYIVATMSSPTMYMRTIPIVQGGGCRFYKDIEKATKTKHITDAEWLISDYHRTTGDTEFELVAIPLEISYRVVDTTASTEDNETKSFDEIDIIKRDIEYRTVNNKWPNIQKLN